MNEQQQYEKHLAEKFQQLPLPDVEPNWQQMKLLLDKEMPRGGGYWRWRTAFGILLLMLGGTWFFISRKDPGTLTAVETKNQSESPKKGSPPGSPAATSFEKQAPGNNDVSDVSKSLPGAKMNQQTQQIKPKNIDENLLNGVPNTTENKIFENAKVISTAPDRLKGDESITVRQPEARSQKSGDKPDGRLNDKLRLQKDEPITDDKNKQADDSRQSVGHVQSKVLPMPEDARVRSSTVTYNPQNILADFEIEKLAGDSIARNYSTIFPESQTTAKLARKAKSAKVSAIESVQNRTVAVGVSLPLGFPLGDQKPGAYNVNARPNTISDFLPVPHMQYHLNNKVYLQTEVQLLNPQFIRPVLLYETKTDVPSANTVYYNSVYARKLYYFNVPLGIHYSPFPHFYLGTGLQFSSFISGVALHEKTSYVIGSGRTNLVSQRYEKFRNDSISNRIDNSEFRVMLDANYYWKQFTVGLRYNQALSNYVSFRLNNISPFFQDKNKSLQFYLRYNLWEDYKRRLKK